MEVHTIVQTPTWRILGASGIIVQFVLGLLSFSALLIKRFFEKPKRPWIVWILDASKQIWSCEVAHWMNMLLAILLSSNNQADDWDWYFLTFTTDVIIGVFLNYLAMEFLRKVALRYRIEALNSGVYISDTYVTLDVDNYHPNRQTEFSDIKLSIWFVQTFVWCLIIIGVKLFLFIFQNLGAPVLEMVSNTLLGWLNIYPDIKLILIMIIIPVIFNGVQFWVQDNILKANQAATRQFQSLSMMERKKSLTLTHTGDNLHQVYGSRRSASFAAESVPNTNSIAKSRQVSLAQSLNVSSNKV